MSAPRTKRQFAGAASDPAQRQITSFFNPSATASSQPSHHHSPSNIPSLPASVQSNLISVGMRVRKSVPEGYKTGTYSAFSLWDDANTAATSHQNHHRAGSTQLSIVPPTSPERNRSRANAFSSPRELMPFCGINRVGGLGVQPGWGEGSCSSSINSSVNDDLDDVPGLTMSQDSVISADSWAVEEEEANNTRKRFFVDDDDEAKRDTQHGSQLPNPFLDGGVSPRSLAPVGWDNGRVFAVPRKMRMRAKAAAADNSNAPATAITGAATLANGAGSFGGMDQENVMVMDADFEEANFLDQQKSWEVSMNDA